MSALQQGVQQVPRRVIKFFLVALAHESLHNYYKTNFALMQYHKYNLQDLELMIPYEREIYVAMLLQYLEEERQKQQSATG